MAETPEERAVRLGEDIFNILGKHLNPRILLAQIKAIETLGVSDLWPDEKIVRVATEPISDPLPGEYPHEDHLKAAIKASASGKDTDTGADRRRAQRLSNIRTNIATQQAHVNDLTAELLRICTEKGIPVPPTPGVEPWPVTGDELEDAEAELAAVQAQFAAVGAIVQGVRGESGQSFGPQEPPVVDGDPLPLPDGTKPGPGEGGKF